MKKHTSIVPIALLKSGAALCLAAMSLILFSCASFENGSTVSEAEAEHIFQTVVKPLFEHRCVWCHSDRKPDGGLNLQNRDLVFDSKLSFVVAGDPQRSRIYSAIDRHPQHIKSMPADGWKITDDQARALRNWIAAGAPWPKGEEGKINRKNYRVDLEDYL